MRRLLAICCSIASFQAVGAEPVAIDTVLGKRVYDGACSSCHGRDGNPSNPDPAIPNFNRGERLLQPDDKALLNVKKGRGGQPPMGHMAESDLINSLAYARTLVDWSKVSCNKAGSPFPSERYPGSSSCQGGLPVPGVTTNMQPKMPQIPAMPNIPSFPR